MSYIDQVRLFHEYLLSNSLSTGEIALWHALCGCNNRLGWRETFAVSNLMLQQLTGLSRQGVESARNRLKQKKLIEYSGGKPGQAGNYKLKAIPAPFEMCHILGMEIGMDAADSQRDSRREPSTLIRQRQRDTSALPSATSAELSSANPERLAPSVPNGPDTPSAQRKPEKKTFPEDGEEMRLSRLLFELMRKNNERCKAPNWQGWAREFDLILRVDKRPAGEVESLIRFSQWHDFWKRNILSPGKLREKYDRLTIERTEEMKKRGKA